MRWAVFGFSESGGDETSMKRKDGGVAEAAESRHVARGIACALAGGVCWGFSGTCAQFLMDGYEVSASWITSVRMFSASVVLLTLLAVRDRKSLAAVARDGRSLAWIALFGLLGMLLTQLSYLSTISYVGAGMGTAIQQTGLALIMLYMCLRSHRLPRLREVSGLLCALVGLVMLATQGDIGRLAVPVEGLAWGGIAALSLAFYTLLPTRMLEKWGSLMVTGLAMLFGGIASLPILRPWEAAVQLPMAALAALAAIVVVGTLAAYLFYLQGVKDAGPVKASLLASVEPVAALAISAVWLKTPVSGWDVAGCAAVVTMVFLVTQREE